MVPIVALDLREWIPSGWRLRAKFRVACGNEKELHHSVVSLLSAIRDNDRFARCDSENKEGVHMPRMSLVVVGVSLLVTNSALAQSYCDQVRQAVAIFGHEASKRHALEHYGKEAVEAGERCLKQGNENSGRPDGSRRRKRTTTKDR